MKEVVAELEFQPVNSDWSLRPVFWVPRDKLEEKPKVVVHIYHTHAVHDQQYCSLINRYDFLAGAYPEFKCNKCATEVPLYVTEKKLLAVTTYKGYDPRNNRKAAVLATKNKGSNKHVGN